MKLNMKQIQQVLEAHGMEANNFIIRRNSRLVVNQVSTDMKAIQRNIQKMYGPLSFFIRNCVGCIRRLITTKLRPSPNFRAPRQHLSRRMVLIEHLAELSTKSERSYNMEKAERCLMDMLIELIKDVTYQRINEKSELFVNKL